MVLYDNIFLDTLSKENHETFISLNSPLRIQEYLDSIPYVGEDLNRTPAKVMADRQCHCLDGGLLAALALRQIGLQARIIDLVPEAGIDDDHVLAIFQINGLFGAVAKSNFSNLRFREPVYRSLRELVMSYFEVFINVDRIKTLRGFTRILNLRHYDKFAWQTQLNGVEQVVKRLYSLKMIPVIGADTISQLNLVDDRSYQSGFLGVNMDGLFKKDIH